MRETGHGRRSGMRSRSIARLCDERGDLEANFFAD